MQLSADSYEVNIRLTILHAGCSYGAV